MGIPVIKNLPNESEDIDKEAFEIETVVCKGFFPYNTLPLIPPV
ncbi:hypothetical protein ADIARSV_2536 [Arcticibacter svalbardensis MN12-7]|uniref:Uncharacterized protein n=1 Tax=Arcticibacter svalbardensis MN12-7 TaxID=1150600 RepID=R9GRX4_9SPHI|nr:hypothetical protein ADIARSV_2536 [Arcticibacter svalbardensis MN12-7]